VPWKETCPMKQRRDFVLERRSGTMSMAALCRAFGISRQTGYKWLARFNERKRLDDLADRSSRPYSHPAYDMRAPAGTHCQSSPAASDLGTSEAAQMAGEMEP